MCNYKKQIFIIVLFFFVVTPTFGRRSGGRSRTSSSRSRTHGSHTTHHTGSSYPKQTYTTNTGTAHTNYGWKTHTGGTNTGHYYNSPHTGSSSTNWGSPHHSPSQNVFATFHPVGNFFVDNNTIFFVESLSLPYYSFFKQHFRLSVVNRWSFAA